METGLVGVLGTLMLTGAVAAQPLDVVAGQAPSGAVGPQVAQRVTGGQDVEQARVVLEDFSAQHDATAERVRVFALPTENIYALRLRVVELDPQNNELAELANQTVGIGRVTLDKSDPTMTGYEVTLDGAIGLRLGARYGIEVAALLTSPTLGDPEHSWRWHGAEGDGSVLVDEGQGFSRVDHPGVAFEVLGEILTPPCVADVNGDGLLSPADLSAWIMAYNTRDPRADQNVDGLVTPGDFSAWITNYNAGC